MVAGAETDFCYCSAIRFVVANLPVQEKIVVIALQFVLSLPVQEKIVVTALQFVLWLTICQCRERLMLLTMYLLFAVAYYLQFQNTTAYRLTETALYAISKHYYL